MPEVGETLREARMRAKIDVSEVEAATKIRAKYLRALENEEWDLLPGPTFVRSFLRTYGDYLGLDSRLLVEEYRARNEGPEELDLAPIGPNLGPERTRLRPPAISRGWIIGLGLLGLLALLILLGSVGGGGRSEPGGVASQGTTRSAPSSGARGVAPAPVPASPTEARLQLLASDSVYVCLIDGSGKRLIDGAILGPGQRSKVFRGRQFSVLFGHGPQAMRVNGRTVAVPASSDPVGYVITPAGRRTLSRARLPSCTQ